MTEAESVPSTRDARARRPTAWWIVLLAGLSLAAIVAIVITRSPNRVLERRLFGIWTQPAGAGSSKTLMEFRSDGYLHDYEPGERARSKSYMGWHASRGRLVITGRRPSQARTLSGRISDWVQALGERLELRYVARYGVEFHDDGSITLVPHSGDAGGKPVTLIRMGDASRDQSTAARPAKS
jgi:hypothetical protein